MKISLACRGRLENRYAVEFIEYYKQLGFDHIFIADNNRYDEEHFEEVLQSYIDEDFITIFNYRNKTQDNCNIYSELYHKISNEYNYDWIFFCDFDEYLTLSQDKNIKKYLSRDCFKNFNQILINWKIYTDNDLVYDDGRPCLERFTTPMEIYKKFGGYFIENELVKCIVKTNIKGTYAQDYNHHRMYGDIINNTTCNNVGYKCNDEKIQKINYDLSYIKHFATKTIDEWINNKCKRGTDVKQYDDFFKLNNCTKRFFEYNNITQEKLDYLKKHNINIDNLNL